MMAVIVAPEFVISLQPVSACVTLNQNESARTHHTVASSITVAARVFKRLFHNGFSLGAAMNPRIMVVMSRQTQACEIPQSPSCLTRRRVQGLTARAGFRANGGRFSFTMSNAISTWHIGFESDAI